MSVHPDSLQTAGQSDTTTTVMIVDDSKVIRLALNKILKQDFTVIQANDGEDAWRKLQEHPEIQGIFSDVSMPNLDGFGLLQRVRESADSHVAALPFIIITANDDDAGFRDRVNNSGGSDLITKPFKTDEIKDCIDKYFDVAQVSEQEQTIAETTPVEVAGSAEPEAAPIEDAEVASLLGLEPETAPDHDLAALSQSSESDMVAEAVADTDAEQAGESFKTTVEFTFDEQAFEESLAAAEPKPEPTFVDDFVVPEFDDVSASASNEMQQAEPSDPVEDNAEEDSLLMPTFEMPADNNIDLDLDLELHDGGHSDEIVAQDVALAQQQPAPESADNSAHDSKQAIDEARQRASEVAQQHAEIEEQLSAEELKRREQEREEIRENLQKLRQQEQTGGKRKKRTKRSRSKKVVQENSTKRQTSGGIGQKVMLFLRQLLRK